MLYNWLLSYIERVKAKKVLGILNIKKIEHLNVYFNFNEHVSNTNIEVGITERHLECEMHTVRGPGPSNSKH